MMMAIESVSQLGGRGGIHSNHKITCKLFKAHLITVEEECSVSNEFTVIK